jgi:uncharacterized protein
MTCLGVYISICIVLMDLHFLNSEHYLLISIAVLYLGPALFYFFQSKADFFRLIDGFTLVIIIELVLIHILPHTVQDVGFSAIFIALLGLILPTLLERVYHKVAKQAHTYTLILALAGVMLHAITDGFALVQPLHSHLTGDAGGSYLPLAITLHRLPVGLAIWALIRPAYGSKHSIIMLLLMTAATLIGYYSANYAYHGIAHESFGLLEAFFAGSLLHVLFHRFEKARIIPKAEGIEWAAGIGAFIGIAITAVIYFHEGQFNNLIKEPAGIFLELALISAPALLIGYLLAGGIQAFLPEASVKWMGRGGHFSKSLRGMLFGLPLPICSCGVVPVYQSLIKQGVPLAAGIAFFVATPELGLDAILLSLPLLGVKFTLIRVLAAAILALSIGWLMGFLYHKRTTNLQKHDDCCSKNKVKPLSFTKKALSGLKTAFGDTVDHTGPWIIIGLGIAAFAQPYLNQNNPLESIPVGLQVIFFALLGMPIYVCASGITPFVAILIHHGVSPGAALAFLLTGPATNVTTFGILSKLHGKQIAMTFAALMATCAIGLGYTVNIFYPEASIPEFFTQQEHSASTIQWGCLWILCIVYGAALIRRGPRYLINQVVAFDSKGHEH